MKTKTNKNKLAGIPTPLALAVSVESALNAISPYSAKRAKLYGITNTGATIPKITQISDHGDVYELLDSDCAQVARTFDAAAVITCGWAAPITDDDETATRPSEHPQKRRVRLVVLVTNTGSASVMRFEDDQDNPISDPGQARGSLADAIHQFWVGNE